MPPRFIHNVINIRSVSLVMLCPIRRSHRYHSNTSVGDVQTRKSDQNGLCEQTTAHTVRHEVQICSLITATVPAALISDGFCPSVVFVQEGGAARGRDGGRHHGLLLVPRLGTGRWSLLRNPGLGLKPPCSCKSPIFRLSARTRHNTPED